MASSAAVVYSPIAACALGELRHGGVQLLLGGQPFLGDLQGVSSEQYHGRAKAKPTGSTKPDRQRHSQELASCRDEHSTGDPNTAAMIVAMVVVVVMVMVVVIVVVILVFVFVFVLVANLDQVGKIQRSERRGLRYRQGPGCRGGGEGQGGCRQNWFDHSETSFA